jgi:chemotaxis protein MotB
MALPVHQTHEAGDGRRNLPLDLPEFRIARAEERSTTWSVPWSDLMMIMFILFLVLFVFSLREKDRLLLGHRTQTSIFMTAGSPEQLQMQSLFELIRERLIGYERDLNIAFLDDASIVITLFGANTSEDSSADLSARLNENSRLLLTKVGQVVGLAQGRVVITGFAEDYAASGTDTDRAKSWEISAVRAAGIAQHLVHEVGLDAGLLVIQATGADLPLSPRLLDLDNRKQRWAEIRLLPDRLLP